MKEKGGWVQEARALKPYVPGLSRKQFKRWLVATSCSGRRSVALLPSCVQARPRK